MIDYTNTEPSAPNIDTDDELYIYHITEPSAPYIDDEPNYDHLSLYINPLLEQPEHKTVIYRHQTKTDKLSCCIIF